MKYPLITFLMLMSITPCFSQISVREQTVKVQKPVLYDSTTVYLQRYHAGSSSEPISSLHNYYQYVGQKIMFKYMGSLSKFTIAKSVVLQGEILVPFEKSEMHMILNHNYNPKPNRKKPTERDEQIERERVKYNDKFKFETNLYKPIFTRYELLRRGNYSSDDLISEIETDLKEVVGKVFTIQDVFAGRDLNNKISLTSDQADVAVTFELTNSNNDTLYWHTAYREIDANVVVMGGYERFISLYKNKTFIYRSSFPHHYNFESDRDMDYDYSEIIGSQMTSVNVEHLDLNSGEVVKFQNLEEWQCTDISLLNDYQDLVYILSNGKNEVSIPIYTMLKNGFLLKEAYAKETELRKLNVEELARKEKQRELAQKQEDEVRKAGLIKKYGQRYATLILNGEVVLGMSSEMCLESWGMPSDINKTTGSWGVHEQWVYSLTCYLYFENGKLTAIQN